MVPAVVDGQPVSTDPQDARDGKLKPEKPLRVLQIEVKISKLSDVCSPDHCCHFGDVAREDGGREDDLYHCIMALDVSPCRESRVHHFLCPANIQGLHAIREHLGEEAPFGARLEHEQIEVSRRSDVVDVGNIVDCVPEVIIAADPL